MSCENNRKHLHWLNQQSKYIGSFKNFRGRAGFRQGSEIQCIVAQSMHCSKVPGQGSKWELDPAHNPHAQAWSWVCLEEGVQFYSHKGASVSKAMLLQTGLFQFIHPEVL